MSDDAQRMISIRFSRRRTRKQCIDFIRRFTSKHGFVSAGRTTIERGGITAEALDQIAKEFWPAPQYSILRREGFIPLPRYKRDKFARKVTCDCMKWRNVQERMQLVAEFAPINSYPYIGAWTWVAGSLRFAGGFITIEGGARDQRDMLASKILKWFGHGQKTRRLSAWQTKLNGLFSGLRQRCGNRSEP